MISVIVATLNSGAVIERLIYSLNEQSSKNFEVIFVDGGSTDDTIEKINQKSKFTFRFLTCACRGIYEALNIGIIHSKHEYYVVIGSDDVFYPEAISIFSAALKEYSDMHSYICFTVDTDEGQQKPLGRPWRYLHRAYISQHSVGSLIKKASHNVYGSYDVNFRQGADADFVMKLANNEAIQHIDKVVGKYSLHGSSNADNLRGFFDAILIQLKYQKHGLVKIVVLLKLIKVLWRK